MKNIFYTFLSLLFAFSASGQLINNGATIIVENGATLYVESDLTSNATGTIEIQGNGKIEVQGNLDNSGTVTMSDNAKFIFSGTTASTVKSGGATLTNVEMSKTAQDITLVDDMTISKDLNFVQDDNKVIIAANDLIFEDGATITSADANEYIVADAAGVVTKQMDAAGMFKYEIGTADDKYTPLDADVTGATFPLSLDVNTSSMKQADVPAEASDFINRFWNVDATDDTNLDVALEGVYDAADLESGATAADVKGAHYGTEWTYFDNAAGTNSVIGRIENNGDFTGTNSFGKIGLKVFLDGAYSGGTMTNALNTMDLLPTTSPYGDGATVDAGFFDANADIVDWIQLETRNSTTPAIVEGSGVAFVKTDGTVVALDGTSDPLLKDASGTGYVVVKHRNHLSVCTGASVSLDGTASLQDFTSTGYSAFGTNAMKNSGGAMVMWAGDINQDGVIKYQGSDNDNTILKNDILSQSSNLFNILTYTYNDYSPLDATLDGVIKYQGSNNDNTIVKNNILDYPSNLFNILTATITEQIPN